MEYPFSYKRMSLRYEKRRIRVRHVVERVGALVLVACSLLVSSAWPDIGVRSYWAGVHIVWTVSVSESSTYIRMFADVAVRVVLLAYVSM